MPAWVPRLPPAAAVSWGLAYTAFAVWKMVAAQPSVCGPEPLEILSDFTAVIEAGVGLFVALPASRRHAALFAFSLNVGLVGFAVAAHVRGLTWEGCRCVPALNLPWLPWHAAIAAGLAAAFLWIFLDAERRVAVAEI